MSEPTRNPAPGALPALFRRLHFYIGVLVGPFLLVAAVSGVLYALTPQIEIRGGDSGTPCTYSGRYHASVSYHAWAGAF